jgi:acetylornithine deacetylase/succinyl-diaminopimelate desuccinylase-like protein
VHDFLVALGLNAVVAAAESGDEVATRAALEASVEDPVLRRSLDAMLRDTVTPTVLHSGQKMNVIPGAGDGEVDVRTLPDTDQTAFLEELRALVGDEVTVEPVMMMPPVAWPSDAPIVQLMDEALRRADPEATPAPMMITPGTDAKALGLLGIPTYGFMPLRLDPETPFLSLFHAHDERLPVSALRFGLPVLHEVVSRFVSR